MTERSDNFEDIKALFIIGDHNIEQMKGWYRDKYGIDTRLSDDDIIDVVARSEDDDSADSWAVSMRAYEDEHPTTDTPTQAVTEASAS